MLSWQKNIIDKNLGKLVEDTICGTLFISILQGDGVLHGDEARNLCNDKEDTSSRAYKLYNLLKSRTDSYCKLKGALLKTRQTGAFDILNNPENEKYVKYEMLTCQTDNPISLVNNTVTIHHGEFGTRPALVKLFRKGPKDNLDQASNELDLLSRLDWHDNIVRCFIGKIVTSGSLEQHFAIALDYTTTLANEVQICTGSRIRSLSTQLVEGASFLHRNRVLHLNLKPESVFISNMIEPIRLKIGDFGISSQLDGNNTTVEISIKALKDKGSASYFTPEVLKHLKGKQSRYHWEGIQVNLGYYTDVFCLATVIYFISSGGEHLFGDEDERRFNMRDYSDPEINEDAYLDVMSTAGRGRFRACLSADPEDRPSVMDLETLF